MCSSMIYLTSRPQRFLYLSCLGLQGGQEETVNSLQLSSQFMKDFGYGEDHRLD